jgi:DNA repair photolyase
MPKCGSQVVLCDIPIRFDTYEGCSHKCTYCFVQRKNTLDVSNGESVDTLKKWIAGQRNAETNWCDWDIPLHWGGMSDPFQPIELERRRSLEALKLFAETQYPFVVSTKSDLISKEPYLSLIKECNCVVQFSAVCDKYDRFETGASTFANRLKAAEKIELKVGVGMLGIYHVTEKGNYSVHSLILKNGRHTVKVRTGYKIRGFRSA